MSRSSILLTSAIVLLLGLCGAAQADEDDSAPHAKAPGQLQDLFITEGTWLRARGEEWFEAQAAAGETRFTENDQASEYTEDGQGTGDFESGWVDSEDEYEFRYDEEEDEFAYWRFLSADTLTAGRQDFVQFCASCHGFDGDGLGRSGQHLRPPPRSFHQSSFKFTKVPIEFMPTDEALLRLVKNGLEGTPMRPWDIPNHRIDDIIQYIKSLSPEETGWRDVYSEFGDVVDIGADPYVSNPAEGVQLGREAYHRNGCYSCHPGYVEPAEINRIAGKPAATAHRSDLTYPKPTRSTAYEVRGHYVQILPPDFTWHQMRVGATPRDVAETVAAGISGAAMPQWKGSGIPDEDFWAIGYYLRDLVDQYKDKPRERAAFMAGLRD